MTSIEIMRGCCLIFFVKWYRYEYGNQTCGHPSSLGLLLIERGSWKVCFWGLPVKFLIIKGKNGGIIMSFLMIL